MTKVLAVEPAGRLWGSERALMDLAENLPELQVGICCPPQTPLINELVRRGIQVFPTFVADLHKKTKLHRLTAAFGVLQACTRFRPNLIHVNQAGAYRTALAAAQVYRVPLIVHVRLFEDVSFLTQRPSTQKLITALIAVSPAVARSIKSCPELECMNVLTIYDGYVQQKISTLAGRIPNRIVCLGRIEQDKRQDLLLRAMKLIPTCELVIAGDGEANFVDALKRECGQGRAISWRGFLSDPIQLLTTASLLACPSQQETLGRVILDAWNAGSVPVVYAGSGGAAELIHESCGGICYTEQTPQCLAEALTRALQLSDEGRSQMISAGRAWMAMNCDPRKNSAAIAELFLSAISQRSKRIA
jgi:glycosyltransferase involved in cell wall biosynthesis